MTTTVGGGATVAVGRSRHHGRRGTRQGRCSGRRRRRGLRGGRLGRVARGLSQLLQLLQLLRSRGRVLRQRGNQNPADATKMHNQIKGISA